MCVCTYTCWGHRLATSAFLSLYLHYFSLHSQIWCLPVWLDWLNSGIHLSLCAPYHISAGVTDVKSSTWLVWGGGWESELSTLPNELLPSPLVFSISKFYAEIKVSFVAISIFKSVMFLSSLPSTGITDMSSHTVIYNSFSLLLKSVYFTLTH